jgi:uncharacterized RDD family membrane protein YckC
MTQWYYSNAQRERLGPVSADDLAQLHENRQIGPETLVWREGYADWKPWREAIADVIPAGTRANASVFDAPARTAAPSVDTFATLGPDAPADANADPYRIAEPVSPYAPPRAQVQDDDDFVAGHHVVYAGFWKRFAASIIDSFVTTFLTYLVQIPMMMVMGVAGATMGGGDPFSSGAGILLMLVIYAISIGIPLLYFSWMHASSFQATLGKMAVGIKVARGDGRRITFWRAFGRYWAFLLIAIFTLGIGTIVSAFTAGLSARKQALHDMLCDTLVVDKYAYTAHHKLQREELGVVTIVILCIGGVFFLGVVAVLLVAGFAMFGGLR